MANNTNTKKLMITCKEATMLSVQKAEITLSFSDRMRLFIHLLVCQYCRLFNKQNKMIDRLLSNWKTDKKLSDFDKNHLQNIIEKELK
ncbi:MAG: hypothetical protein IPH97_13835 [Ignavibacteriales bacterium]|nr:hypothetical protein [Ignavibacteriales bacterium]